MHRVADRWHWAAESYPADEISLRSDEIAALRKRIDMIMARRPDQRPPLARPADRPPLSLKDVLPGEDCINAAGVCFINEHQVDASGRHGHRRIMDFSGLSMQVATRMGARKMLSLLHKRACRWEDAVGLWQQMIRDQPGDLFALIELAKWYEHRAHDYATALKLVGLALRQTDERAAAAEREALLRRLQRLQRRHAEHAPEK